MKYIVKIEPDAQNDLEEGTVWYENDEFLMTLSIQEVSSYAQGIR